MGAVTALVAFVPAARGATWSSPQPIAPQTTTSDVAVRTDAAGDAIAVWTSTTGVFAAIAPAHGSFAAPQRLSRHPISRGELSTLLAVDPRGDAILAWTQPGGSGAGPLYAAYRPAGGAFGPDHRVAASARTVDLGLDDAGDATLVFDDAGRGDSVLAVTRYAAGRYGRSQRLSGPRCSEVDVAVDGSGRAVATWAAGSASPTGIQYATRTRAAGAFGRAVTVVKAKPGGDEPAVGLDAAGEGLLAWEGPYRATGAGGPYRGIETIPIRVGASAGGPISPVIASGQGGPRDEGEMPEVAVDPGGDAVLAWDTYRPNDGGQDGVEVARGRVGRPLPAASTVHVGVLDDGADLAQGPEGQAVVAWDDLFGPDGARIASGPRAAFGPPETISSGSEESGLPLVAIGATGALAVWQDLGSTSPGTAPAATPLLYARAG